MTRPRGWAWVVLVGTALVVGLLGWLIVELSAQERPEPAEPPPGWFCSREAKDPAHHCDCHRQASGDDCQYPGHDQTCTVYCWEEHCHCPVTCEGAH